jgi:hypothetical protein
MFTLQTHFIWGVLKNQAGRINSQVLHWYACDDPVQDGNYLENCFSSVIIYGYIKSICDFGCVEQFNA